MDILQAWPATKKAIAQLRKATTDRCTSLHLLAHDTDQRSKHKLSIVLKQSDAEKLPENKMSFDANRLDGDQCPTDNPSASHVSHRLPSSTVNEALHQINQSWSSYPKSNPRCEVLKSNQSASTSTPSNITQIAKEILEEIATVANSDLETLGTTPLFQHQIKIVEGTKPIKQKMRLIPYQFKEEFHSMLKKMITAGKITPSTSEWASPLCLLWKKDGGGLRFTVDFKKINAATIRECYPIPNIDAIFNRLAKAVIFTTLDLTSAYHQVPLSKESQQYTAFICEFGQFQYTVMPMGTMNATFCMQRIMELVLSDLIGRICFAYLDDIIVFSDITANHLSNVKLVTERLRQFNLKIKLEKSKVAQTRIEYLSHIIENGTIAPGPAKISALFQKTIPTSVTQIRSFLGLAQYYKKFIKGFAGIASPLYLVTSNGNKFVWTEACTNSFNQLR